MGIQSNIWKLKADRLLSESFFFLSVLVPFLESNGLKASDIYRLEAIFAATMVVCQIPTGYFADVMGRKTSMLIGSIFYPLSLLIYALSHSFWGFAAAEASGAIAISLRSGADTALLYDTLIELKREKEHKRIEGQAYLLQRLGSFTANIAGGFLGMIALNLPIFVTAAVGFIKLPLILSMKETQKEPSKKKTPRMHVADLGCALNFCGTHALIRNASLYLAFIGGINLMGYWSYYLYYSKLGIPVAYFGLLAAAGSLSAGVGAHFFHVIEKKTGERAAFLLPLLTAPSYILIAWIDSVWAVPFILLNAFLWGLAIPLLRDTLHKHTRSTIRATVLSVSSMGDRMIYVVMAFGIGTLVDSTSLEAGIAGLGACFALCCSFPALALMRATPKT